MEGEREGQQLLEPLIDIEGYAVPFGEHERMMDLQLPPLPVSSARLRDRENLKTTPISGQNFRLSRLHESAARSVSMSISQRSVCKRRSSCYNHY